MYLIQVFLTTEGRSNNLLHLLAIYTCPIIICTFSRIISLHFVNQASQSHLPLHILARWRLHADQNEDAGSQAEGKADWRLQCHRRQVGYVIDSLYTHSVIRIEQNRGDLDVLRPVSY
jgi:hypothetical protein